ncbi:MAG TPA: RidA family protein [Candidatus Baltobacteraceae bacterium]|nr:RidA family protein [Candidatus Baltobacteraceae bacterium]
MAANETVRSDGAPAPIGPYSQAIRSGKTLYCSGQIALDPTSGALIDGDVAAQTEQAMKNLGAVLRAAGFDYDDIVKTSIFLIDMNDFAAVNEVYGRYVDAAKPARSTVAVAALPRGARVEIDCIARK